MEVIDRALEQGKRLRIRYRGAKDGESSWRAVDPVELRVSDQQPYLVAYDADTARFKTYKLARVSQVTILAEKVSLSVPYDGAREFEHTRTIWSGDVREVAVRIRAASARFVAEWPMAPRQSVEDLPNGDVVVRAHVAGLLEPMRWVLSWGQHATVWAPAELREAVIGELAQASRNYRGPGQRKVRGVSRVETAMG